MIRQPQHRTPRALVALLIAGCLISPSPASADIFDGLRDAVRAGTKKPAKRERPRKATFEEDRERTLEGARKLIAESDAHYAAGEYDPAVMRAADACKAIRGQIKREQSIHYYEDTAKRIPTDEAMVLNLHGTLAEYLLRVARGRPDAGKGVRHAGPCVAEALEAAQVRYPDPRSAALLPYYNADVELREASLLGSGGPLWHRPLTEDERSGGDGYGRQPFQNTPETNAQWVAVQTAIERILAIVEPAATVPPLQLKALHLRRVRAIAEQYRLDEALALLTPMVAKGDPRLRGLSDRIAAVAHLRGRDIIRQRFGDADPRSLRLELNGRQREALLTKLVETEAAYDAEIQVVAKYGGEQNPMLGEMLLRSAQYGTDYARVRVKLERALANFRANDPASIWIPRAYAAWLEIAEDFKQPADTYVASRGRFDFERAKASPYEAGVRLIDLGTLAWRAELPAEAERCFRDAIATAKPEKAPVQVTADATASLVGHVLAPAGRDAEATAVFAEAQAVLAPFELNTLNNFELFAAQRFYATWQPIAAKSGDAATAQLCAAKCAAAEPLAAGFGQRMAADDRAASQRRAAQQAEMAGYEVRATMRDLRQSQGAYLGSLGASTSRRCTNCGTSFDGAACPNCGRP